MDRKLITQKDIADAVGLNHSTVSLALRGSDKVAPESRELILKTAREMGYLVNAAASNLAKFRADSNEAPVTAALAWLNCWENPKDLFRLREFELYWEGANRLARRFGYQLDEFVVDREMSLSRVQQILVARGIQGVLIPPHGFPVDFSAVDWSQFSIMRFGKSVIDPAAHMITSDHVGNLMLAFAEIYKRGYRRIGLVDHQLEENWFTFDAGFYKAQELHGVRDYYSIFRIKSNDLEQTRGQWLQWMQRMRPDAIIVVAAEIVDVLKQEGYTIGKDIAVATMSISDTEISAGIYQNSDKIGEGAALGLISQIQDSDKGIPEVPRQIFVPGKWVDGDSLPDLRVGAC